jgi:hypothetical protein
LGTDQPGYISSNKAVLTKPGQDSYKASTEQQALASMQRKHNFKMSFEHDFKPPKAKGSVEPLKIKVSFQSFSPAHF